MAGTDRLTLYNNALMLIGERFLSALTDNVEARRLLDNAWQGNQGVQYCLEQGFWQFAMRTQMIYPDPDLAPQFGYVYGYDKPDDWVNTYAFCSDERFRTPIQNYSDETAYWTTDISPIYIKYVSNDIQFGMNLGAWPVSFQEYVAAYLASKVCYKLSSNKQMLAALMTPRTGFLAKTRTVALNRAAMTQPTQFTSVGSWVRSRFWRRGSAGPFGDGGTTGSL